MNRDNHLIYEGYRQKRHLTPKESLQRDKEFFNYVIESNSHLSSLKNFSTKKLFSSYVSTLANRIDSDNPGLIRESNMSDAEAFGILNEATQTVSDQEAYDAVKDIFEEIAVKQLIRKADILLEQQRSFVRRGVGGSRIKNQDGSTSQVSRGVGGQTITTNQPAEEPVADQPAGKKPLSDDPKNVARRQQNALNKKRLNDRPRLAQKYKDLYSSNKELTKANQEGAARIAELEAKIQEMEAAEANMSQQQKAQSDAIQDQLAAMIKQIQNTNTNTAANQNVINIGGGYGAPQGAPAAPAATEPAAPAAAAPADKKTPAETPTTPEKPKPGLMSRVGAGIKKYLPAIGNIGGATLGSALGPVGTVLGGALGRGLGRFFSPTDPKAGFKKRAWDALKSAGMGALAGGVGQAGAEMIGNTFGGAESDLSSAGGNSSSVTARPTAAEVASEPGAYAQTNPSQPYTPGAGDSNNKLPGFQDDEVGSSGMPDDVVQPSKKGKA